MIFYIFLSYIWWTILLLEKNNETYLERVIGLKQQYKNKNIDLNKIYDTEAYKLILHKKESQRYMVLGESSVFLFLILIISWQVFRSFRKEIELNRTQKNFLLSITHELRSPIASVKLAMQTLHKKQDLPVEKSNRLIDNSLNDIERLHSLVENLLLSAKIESASFIIGKDEINLSELLTNTITKLHDTVAKHRKFNSQITEGVKIKGDKNAMISVIQNLIENAIKYSPDESPISISLLDQNDHAVLVVADEGKGIDESERRKIFKKFYRIGNEETRNSKGTGLGLYIVDHMVSLHHGKIYVKDNNPQGTKFEIILPSI